MVETSNSQRHHARAATANTVTVRPSLLIGVRGTPPRDQALDYTWGETIPRLLPTPAPLLCYADMNFSSRPFASPLHVYSYEAALFVLSRVIPLALLTLPYGRACAVQVRRSFQNVHGTSLYTIYTCYSTVQIFQRCFMSPHIRSCGSSPHEEGLPFPFALPATKELWWGWG
jgi:hypothetical protein